MSGDVDNDACENAEGPRAPAIEVEQFLFAQAGLSRKDFNTVAMAVNDHFFRFELAEFIEFVTTMAGNAKRFADVAAALRKKPDEKAN